MLIIIFSPKKSLGFVPKNFDHRQRRCCCGRFPFPSTKLFQTTNSTLTRRLTKAVNEQLKNRIHHHHYHHHQTLASFYDLHFWLPRSWSRRKSSSSVFTTLLKYLHKNPQVTPFFTPFNKLLFWEPSAAAAAAALASFTTTTTGSSSGEKR